MLKRLLCLAVIPIILGCSARSLPESSNPWPEPYQAVFSVPAGSATMEEHRYSDGQGRIRVDVPFQDSRRSINVYDLRKNEKLGWTEGTGEYLCEPLKFDEVPYFSADRLQSLGAPSLGQKMINGLSCRGYGGPQGELWVDCRYGLPVQTTAGGAAIKMISFSQAAPAASLFEVPAGYQKMATTP